MPIARINHAASLRQDVSRDRAAKPPVFEQYRRMLVMIVLAVAASTLLMAIFAGATWEDATLVGVIGLLVGVAIAGYTYRLLVQVRTS